MMDVRLLACVPLALLAACGQAADPETVLETVRATEQAQLEAIANDDQRGAVRVYEDQAVLVAPGAAAATGAEAIGTSYQALLADPNFALDVTQGPGWAAGSGDFAVTTFTAQMTTTDSASGNPVTVPIGNQTVWRKAEGAPWMIVSNHNVVLPATDAVATAETAAP